MADMTPEQALREAINHVRFLADHLEGRMGDAALADMRMMADEWEGALPTPPEASTMDHGGVGQVGCEGEDGLLRVHSETEACDVCAPQQPEDALADYMAIEDYADYGRQPFCSKVEFDRKCENVRRHLTASAVPGQIRRMPEEWRKVAAATRVTSLSDAAEEASADIYDQCADELERALASMPAVCEWKHRRTSLGRDGYRGSCGSDWWCEEGFGPALISDMHPYCHGCGRRIQIAAAPTKGGR